MMNNEKEQFDYEERTAIMEFDGGLNREDAENNAYVDIIQKRRDVAVLHGVRKPNYGAKVVRKETDTIPVIYGGTYD